MQILANALPGFRDIRAPAVAGYLWLFFAWLVVNPDIDHRPGGGLSQSVYDLGHQIGRPAVLAAVSVAAYLVGALSQEVAPLVRATVTRITDRGYSEGIRMSGDRRRLLSDPRRSGPSALRAEWERATGLVNAAAEDLPREVQDDVIRQAIDDYWTANSALRAELSLPAMLLVGDEPQLFAEVDRLKSEGDLRLAVAVPMVAIVALLASHSPWWLVALPMLAGLALQGVRREEQARKVIDDSIAHGRIKSSAVAGYRDSVNNLQDTIRELVT